MNVYEVEAITRMVQLGSVRKYDHLLRPEYFNEGNREIYEALRTYEAMYGTCMDEPTFRLQWPDFDWTPAERQIEWLADELGQGFVATRLRDIWTDAEPVLDDNPREMYKALQEKLLELRAFVGDPVGEKVGLISHARQRLARAREHRVVEGLSGITTGFALLDDVTNGTQRGEIELYVARPGMGKSLTLLYGCYCAWRDQGKRVSFISPEMTAYEMGIRLDSMHLHLSSMRMQSGRMQDDELTIYSDNVEEWIEEMKNDIIFREAHGLGRRFTTGDLARIIEADNCDLLAVDGLMLIDPIVPGKDVRTRLVNLMEEVKSLTTRTGVPIRMAHQANRSSETQTTKKRKDINPTDVLPELHHLAESGATEQYANRVITMTYWEGRMYYAVRKNRMAPTGRMFSVNYLIDTGVITDSRVEDGTVVESKPQQQALLKDEDGDDAQVPF